MGDEEWVTKIVAQIYYLQSQEKVFETMQIAVPTRKDSEANSAGRDAKTFILIVKLKLG